MKGISYILKKIDEFFLFTCREYIQNSFGKVFLNFENGHKKNVQFSYPQKVLTDEIFCLDKKKLSSEFKR